MTRPRPLVWALIISGALHAALLVDIDWEWPFAEVRPDEVLAKKKAEKVKRVRLALSGPATDPVIPVVTLLGDLNARDADKASAEAASHLPGTKPAHPAPRPVTTTAATPAAAGSGENPAVASQAPAEVDEPAPSFPVSVQATHRANYYGFRMDLKQQWLLEGYNYLIRNDARKFGFTALLTSEGKVTPDGLQPEHYRLMLNGQLKQYADFDRVNGVVIHGKAGSSHSVPITSDFQDMASLPYHVAVSYEGESERTIKVTTGNSVYDVVLRLEAEETLKLPGGTLRTLHLTGSRTRQDGTLQAGYDIWLAPGLRNYPVKFRGPDSKGNFLEMAVLSLTFDGKRVFGKDGAVPDLPDEPEALPDSLRDQHDIRVEPPAPTPEPPPAPAPASGPAATSEMPPA